MQVYARASATGAELGRQLDDCGDHCRIDTAIFANVEGVVGDAARAVVTRV